MLALTAKSLITPLEVIAEPIVLIDDGRIADITTRAARELPSSHTDLGDVLLAPGLLDVHIHGGISFDVMQATESELADFERFLAEHGITSYLPTTVTAPEDQIERSLERLSRAVAGAASTGSRARPLGIHLEGPFISHAKRGVHPAECLRPADIQLFDRFYDAAAGALRMMTFAPELDNADAFIRHAVSRGVTVSLGHSDATYSQTHAGISAGARTATHTFNAMRQLDHREPGILGAVLTAPSLMADIIADGVHTHPDMIRLFLAAKGEERAILITDALSATGMPDGTYRLGPFDVDVKGDRCEHDGRLAGSVLTLDKAVRNVMRFAGWPLARALRLASHNPAQLLGLNNKGALSSGADADLIALSPNGNVVRTIIAGQLCPTRRA